MSIQYTDAVNIFVQKYLKKQKTKTNLAAAFGDMLAHFRQYI